MRVSDRILELSATSRFLATGHCRCDVVVCGLCEVSACLRHDVMQAGLRVDAGVSAGQNMHSRDGMTSVENPCLEMCGGAILDDKCDNMGDLRALLAFCVS